MRVGVWLMSPDVPLAAGALRELAIARAAEHGPYEALSISWPRTTGKSALLNFLSEHGPADAIRRYEYALKVLGMHQWRAPGVNCGCDKGMCSCGEHVPWPCDELIWLATSLGVEVSS